MLFDIAIKKVFKNAKILLVNITNDGDGKSKNNTVSDDQLKTSVVEWRVIQMSF